MEGAPESSLLWLRAYTREDKEKAVDLELSRWARQQRKEDRLLQVFLASLGLFVGVAVVFGNFWVFLWTRVMSGWLTKDCQGRPAPRLDAC